MTDGCPATIRRNGLGGRVGWFAGLGALEALGEAAAGFEVAGPPVSSRRSVTGAD